MYYLCPRPLNLNYALDALSVSVESFCALRLISGKDPGQATWLRLDVVGIMEDTS